MKLKNVSSKEATTQGVALGGAVVGAMFGRGLTAIATKPAIANAPTPAEDNKKMYVQLAMVALGAYGMMAIDGNDTTANALKGVATGIALDNALNVVTTLVGKSDTLKTKLVADTSTNTFVKGALGLGCPGCESNTYRPYTMPVQQLNRPRKALRIPSVVAANGSNHLIGNVLEEGKALLYA